MLRVYCELLDDVPYLPLLYPNLGTQERGSILFLNNAFRSLQEPFVTLTERPEDSDYILLPHNFSALRYHRFCIDRHAALAEQFGKPLLVFWHGDGDAPVGLPHAIVVRTSQYGYKKRNNEIMMPAYTEDLLAGKELPLRDAHGGKPVVGFCGWGDYKNLKNRIGTYLKDALVAVQVLAGQTHKAVHRKGLSIRMELIAHLRRSVSVETNFLIRSSYSGHTETIRSDADTARREYRDNLLASDFPLVIKGDGNYSYRFTEALSLGRLPLLIDTDCVLPLADRINYDRFTIRVPYAQRFAADALAAERFAALSPESYVDAQHAARDAFATYLSPAAFLRLLVNELIPEKAAQLSG